MDTGLKYKKRFEGTFEPFYTFQDNPVMYRKIHYWMWRYMVRAFKCKCGSTQKMNMSLIPGKPYAFDVNNFEPMCNSCNQKQDWTIEKRIKNKTRTRKTYESVEYRKKLSKKVKEAWSNPDMRKRQSEKLKKYYSDPKNRKKQSEKIKQYFSNLENRERQSEKIKKAWKEGRLKKINQKSMSGIQLDCFS